MEGLNALLAVSWAMPPLVAPRAINVARSLAALRDLGWSTDVVTAAMSRAQRAGWQFDDDLAGRYARAYRGHPVAYADGKGLLSRLRRGLGVAEASWEDAAFAAAARLANESPFRAMITFAQPFSDHAVGLRLKARFRALPWLAHFSDPWVDNPYIAVSDDDRRMEQATVEQADGLVFTTQRALDRLLTRYAPSVRDKCFVVPHGFAETAPPARNRQGSANRLRLLHTGGLYGKRLPHALLEALCRLRDHDDSPPPRIRCIGPVDPAFQKAVAARGLQHTLTFEPPRPVAACMSASTDADMLLVIDAPASESLFLPSKLVDYLPLGLPILALTPREGPSADLLREVGGVVVPPDVPEAMADALKELSDRARRGSLGDLRPDGAKIRRYHIGETTLLLDAALRRIAGETPGRV